MSKFENIRAAAFDIECTGLEASYGRLICACFQFLDEDEPRTKAIKSIKQEKVLLHWIKEQFKEIDVLLTWNGKLFDVPFVNARRMQHGLVALEPMKHVDLMYQARKLRTRGSRLDGVAKDLRFTHQKIDVPAWRWVHAAEGDQKAIDLIVKHCEQDVRMTAEAWGKFRPMVVRITR